MLDLYRENVIDTMPGAQLQFLRYLLTGQSPAVLVENMDLAELSRIYDFIWEKSLEIGIRVKGERFSQSDVLKRLKSVEQYKAEVGCTEPLHRCMTNECITENQQCARNKLKDQLNRLYALIADYLGINLKM